MFAVAFAACGDEGGTSPNGPMLLAQVSGDGGGDICCGTWTALVRAAICLAYADPTWGQLGSGPPYATGGTVLGCDRAHLCWDGGGDRLWRD